MSHFELLIIGGGTAGIMVAAQTKRKNPSVKIGLIEPSEKHYYQPAWTLVGANTYNFKDTEREESAADTQRSYLDKRACQSILSRKQQSSDS